MATVVLLVGLPGSGKSFLARRLCEALDSCIHIEYDSVAESLSTASDDLEAWRESRVLAFEMFKSKLDEEAEFIILDDNMHLRSMRKSIYRHCQDRVLNGSTIYFGTIFVDTPVSVCLDRNQTRDTNRFIPVGIIKNMSSNLEPPDPQKASWEVNYIRINGAEKDKAFEVSRDWILSLKCDPVPPPPPEVDKKLLELERQATKKNLLHQYDMAMRKWVGAVAKIAPRQEVKARVADANRARKVLLVDLRASDDDKTMEKLIDDFCSIVCQGWNDQQMQLLRENLITSNKE